MEKERPENGLGAFGDDGDDLMLALARQIVSGEEDPVAETLEAVFAQAQDAEAASEEYLVDDDWKAVEAEPEPVSVEVHSNGGSGHGQVVEPIVVSGHGPWEESVDGQQSFFLG